MTKHVAILGARGFVGRALCAKLSAASEISVKGLARPEFDLTRPETFSAISPQTDAVVLASAALPGADANEIWRVNVQATHDLVQYLSSMPNPPHLHFLSSGAVSYLKPGSSSAYAMSKSAAEHIIAQTYAGPHTIYRLYFPFGEGQSSDRLVPRLIEKVIKGEAVQVGNDGGPALSLTYIDDLTKFLEANILHPTGGVLDVGGELKVRMSEILDLIERFTGKSAARTFSEVSSSDMIAKSAIGAPAVEFTERIRAMCQRTA